MSFKENLGFRDHRGSTLIALKAVLMKPRKEFIPVAGKKNRAWIKLILEK